MPASRSFPKPATPWALGFAAGFWACCTWRSSSSVWKREQDIDLIQTAPNVTYQILSRTGEVLTIDNPQDVPDAGQIDEFREPIARVNFIVPAENIGTIMQLCEDRRGTFRSTEYLGTSRAQIVYELPLGEIVYDMYDKLKSVTRGYGTMDYEVIGFRPADLVKMDILVKGNRVDALSTIVHRSNAEKRGRALVKRLKDEISKHMFEIPLQAAIGSRVIARETISALRKERDRQMLRRRHHPQAQTLGQAKRRQKTDETIRPGRNPPESLSVRAGSQQGGLSD